MTSILHIMGPSHLSNSYNYNYGEMEVWVKDFIRKYMSYNCNSLDDSLDKEKEFHEIFKKYGMFCIMDYLNPNKVINLYIKGIISIEDLKYFPWKKINEINTEEVVVKFFQDIANK